MFVVKTVCGISVYTLVMLIKSDLSWHNSTRIRVRWSLTFCHPPEAIVASRHGEIPKLIIRCHRRSDFVRKQSGSGAFGRLNKQRYYLINSLIMCLKSPPVMFVNWFRQRTFSGAASEYRTKLNSLGEIFSSLGRVSSPTEASSSRTLLAYNLFRLSEHSLNLLFFPSLLTRKQKQEIQ